MILGLGAAPSAPRNLHCRPLTCRSVACTWDPPAEPGHPPFHKFKLERLGPGDGSAAAAWETANGELDDEDLQFVDTSLPEVHRPPPTTRPDDPLQESDPGCDQFLKGSNPECLLL